MKVRNSKKRIKILISQPQSTTNEQHPVKQQDIPDNINAPKNVSNPVVKHIETHSSSDFSTPKSSSGKSATTPVSTSKKTATSEVSEEKSVSTEKKIVCSLEDMVGIKFLQKISSITSVLGLIRISPRVACK